jgi:hypothetical protein
MLMRTSLTLVANSPDDHQKRLVLRDEGPGELAALLLPTHLTREADAGAAQAAFAVKT